MTLNHAHEIAYIPDYLDSVTPGCCYCNFGLKGALWSEDLQLEHSTKKHSNIPRKMQNRKKAILEKKHRVIS